MRQYGKKKTKTRVKDHQDCAICHPDREKPRKKRARQKARSEVKDEVIEHGTKYGGTEEQ